MKRAHDKQSVWKAFINGLHPWMHLVQFVIILSIAWLFKHGLVTVLHWKVPALAAWELAALVHVFLVAQKLMEFQGFQFASKSFNSRVKRYLLNALGLLIPMKLLIVVFEMLELADYSLPKEALGVVHAMHFIAPYVVMLPLFLFFVVNFVAWLHVGKQARELDIDETDQQRYLGALMKFVDAPVVLPFVVMVIYLKFMDRMVEKQSEDLVIGIIGCCLLIVSNLLTGVFHEHWADVTKNRREHSSGLV